MSLRIRRRTVRRPEPLIKVRVLPPKLPRLLPKRTPSPAPW